MARLECAAPASRRPAPRCRARSAAPSPARARTPGRGDHRARRPRQAVGRARVAGGGQLDPRDAGRRRRREQPVRFRRRREHRRRAAAAREPPHPRIGQAAVHDDGAAPPPARNPEHDERARADDDVREQREGVARRAACRRRRPENARRGADGPSATAGPPGRSTGTMTTLPISAAGSRPAASRAAASAAVVSTPRSAPTTLTRGPGFSPTTTQAGIDGATGASAGARRRPTSTRAARRLAPRRQRDGDRARLAGRDRHATDPNTACGRLDQHRTRSYSRARASASFAISARSACSALRSTSRKRRPTQRSCLAATFALQRSEQPVALVEDVQLVAGARGERRSRRAGSSPPTPTCSSGLYVKKPAVAAVSRTRTIRDRTRPPAARTRARSGPRAPRRRLRRAAARGSAPRHRAARSSGPCAADRRRSAPPRRGPPAPPARRRA